MIDIFRRKRLPKPLAEAQRKRALERALRDHGFTRTEAVLIVGIVERHK